MSDDTVLKLSQPSTFSDPLTEVLRSGARSLLARAVEAEVAGLPPMAVGILEDLPRRADSPWVFPGRDPERHLSTVNHLWLDVRARAGLVDVRLHDLRHSFASRALALGETLPVIGKLLGHSDIETTARYAHLARDSLHEAAARVAGSIAADIL